ncbi:MAG: hypothetical protein E6Q89_05895 [Bacteroidia bacterium]|nr:MAG: hypothetical protein E6Q89_05895 [Bacteroidia bacterium]
MDASILIPVHAFMGFPFPIMFFKDLPTEYKNIISKIAKGSATTHVEGIYLHDAVRFFYELDIEVTFQEATFYPTNKFFS